MKEGWNGMGWNGIEAVFDQIQVPWLLAQQSSLKIGKSKLKLLEWQYPFPFSHSNFAYVSLECHSSQTN